MDNTTPNKRLYLGNLSWETTEETLRAALQQNGRTASNIDIKIDARTGRSRGFAFAELASEEELQAAIDELHGTELDGRPLKVSTANHKKVTTGGYGREDRGGYGDRRGGGGGGGGGRRW